MKIEVLSNGKKEVIRFGVKRDRLYAEEILNELTAAVHIGAAINAQIDRGNISELAFSDGQEFFLFSEDALPLTLQDLTGDGLDMLKRARRKLADKLGLGL